MEFKARAWYLVLYLTDHYLGTSRPELRQFKFIGYRLSGSEDRLFTFADCVCGSIHHKDCIAYLQYTYTLNLNPIIRKSLHLPNDPKLFTLCFVHIFL